MLANIIVAGDEGHTKSEYIKVKLAIKFFSFPSKNSSKTNE